MNLIAQAVLVDHRGRPAPDVDVELCTVDVRGRARRQATATTGRRGEIRFRVRLAGVEVQPRLLLRTRMRNRIVPLTDTPPNFRGSRASFGTVSLPPPDRVATAEALEAFKEERAELLEMINREGPRIAERVRPEELERRLEERVREERARRQEAEKRLTGVRRQREELRERVEGLEADVEELRAEAERLREGAELPGGVEGLVLSSQLQLQQAEAKIRSAGGPYRLGKVSFHAKVIPDEEGKGFRLPTHAELGEYTGPFSEVNYDFTPTREGDERAAASPLPDLLGLTEELARVRAREAGFHLQARGRTVPADSREVGRVVRQVPAPTSDKELPPGSTITVLIGRPLEPAPETEE